MICNLCPRNCGAERTETEGKGFCGMPSVPVLARAALHMWEEPPISGKRGSGTIFFSGCSLRCAFCQNEQISRDCYGKPITMERLREICQELIAQGAHNINFVNPTHYAHVIAQLLEEPLEVPVVFNTGGYDKMETLQMLEGKVDIYLPDLKYVEANTAQRYSKAADYPERAKKAILEMFRQTGPCQFDEDGMLKKGVIIRHLVLPGQLEAAKQVMDWVNDTFAPGDVLFSLMSQYIPYGHASDYPEINRPLRKSEARKANEYMDLIGLDGFTQEPTSASEQFIPPFDLTGVEKQVEQ